VRGRLHKTDLSERDICTKYITPALLQAGWQQHQFREEVGLTEGRVLVRGNLAMRLRNADQPGGPKRADYVLYAHPNVPLAVVEAKRNTFSVGHGMQQALAEGRPWGKIRKGYTHFAAGDVVLAKITPCFENGKAAVICGLPHLAGAGTTELHVVRPIDGLTEPGYLYCFLRSPLFTVEGRKEHDRTTGPAARVEVERFPPVSPRISRTERD